MGTATFVDLLSSLVERPSEEGRGFTFLEDGERSESRLSYVELDRRARAIAVRLREVGATGERVLLLYPPGLDYIAAFFGCLYAGAIAVPAYPPDPTRLGRTVPRLEAIVRDAQASIALTSSTILSMAELVFAQAAILQQLRWIATDVIDDAIGGAWQRPDVDGETLAFLQYTSGSTGTPKGVMLTHGNLLHNQRMIRAAFEHTDETVVVGWLPLYHDMGLIGNILQPLYMGIPCVLMSPLSFLQKPVRWLQAISRYRATTSGGPNFAYDLCARKVTEEEIARLDLFSWRLAFNGAEPVRADTMDRFAKTFAGAGFRKEAFYPCYGLAESALIVSGGARAAVPVVERFDAGALERGHAEPKSDGGRALIGCGRALLDERIVVVDPERRVPRGIGEVGEIWVASDSVARGYWNQPEETAHSFGGKLANGDGPFLRTGDLGFLRDGELFVVGRVKDLIIVRGRNHYPQDIERTVEAVAPGVLRPGCGAAFSIDEDGEERLVLVQEVDARAAADLDEVLSQIRQAVAEAHELSVRAVVLVKAGSISKTSSGKIQRRACRVDYLAGALEGIKSWPARPAEEVARPSSVQGGLAELIARHLRVAPEELRRGRPLTEYGIDSLAAVELQSAIEAELGLSVPMVALLEGLSLRELERRAQPVRPPTSSEPDDGSLTTGEASLFLLQKTAPDSRAYHVVRAARVRSAVDEVALEQALLRLTERHPALRTAFVDTSEGPRRRIDEVAKIELSSLDATAWSKEQLDAALEAEAARPFDLGHAPLMRLGLWRRSGETVLVLSLHHIITDLWSLALVMRELGLLYREASVGEKAQLRALARRDAARDEAAWLRSDEGKKQLEYWKTLLEHGPRLELASGRPRPATRRFTGAMRSLELGRERSAALRRLSDAHQATLFMTLEAAFQVLLHRYSGQRDFVVGTVTTGRTAANASQAGYFVNPLALRADLSGAPTFSELLERVRGATLQAFKHQEAPFAKVVERVQPTRDPSRSPLFDVMFVLQRTMAGSEGIEAFAIGAPGAKIDLGGLALESLAVPERAAQFDLSMVVAELPDGLTASLTFDADLYDEAFADRLLAHYQRLLDSIVERPEGRVGELGLLNAAERYQLLVEWNDTARAYPKDALIHELFAAQAKKTPDAMAVVCEDARITYRVLDERSNQLARHLQQRGVGPDVLVGLCLERSVEMIVGLLGVLKAGGAYVPLDPSYPSERLEYMVKDSAATLLVAQQQTLPAHAAEVVYLDRDWSQIERQEKSAPPTKTRPEHLAYVIYTSGSTGRPKGVEVTHRSVTNMATAYAQKLELGEGRRVFQFASIAFDASVEEMWKALVSGAELHLSGERLLAGPLLAEKLHAAGITDVTLPPTVLQSLGATELPELKSVISAGEACTQELIDRWAHGRRFINGYGPTEATVCATWSVCEAGKRLLIGAPIPNAQVYVVDGEQRTVPVGVPGELCVGGAGLARGYLGRAELTAERFVPNPYGQPGARMYRTGDLARWLPDGNLEYLGRLDHQVKIRGFRIELGEIESALVDAGAKEAVVVAREDAPGHKRLVAYVTGAVEVGGLRTALSTRLPEYMVPSAFVALEAMPLSPNGKVDRKALPAPEYKADEYVAPRTAVEVKLAAVWKELLKLERVGVRDHFFELGGDSILGIQMVSRARALGVEVTPKQLFEHPRVEDLAKVAGRAVEVNAEQGVLEGASPLSPIEGWFFEHGEKEEPNHFNQAVLLKSKEAPNEGALATALAAVLKQHDALRLRYRRIDGRWTKALSGKLEAPTIDRIDLRKTPDAVRAMEAHATELQASLDLETGPLVKACVYELGAEGHRLLVVIHHVAVDGVSWRVLLEDLEKGYEEAKKGKAIELGKKTSSVRQWGERLLEWARNDAESELAHWRGISDEGRLPRKRTAASFSGDMERLQVALTAEETEALLTEVPSVYRTQVNDGLLLALGEAFEGWTGADRLLVNLEGHGREELFADLDVSRTVGWFTSLYPVVVDLSAAKETAARLKAVKEQQRKVPSRGLGYGVLKYLGRDVVRRELVGQHAPEVSFNYLGQLDQALPTGSVFEVAAESSGKPHSPGRVRDHLIDVTAWVSGGRLQLSFEYGRELHHEETIAALAEGYTKSLRRLVEHCRKPEAGGRTPSDFPLAKLSQAELDRLVGKGESVEEVYGLSPMQEGMLFLALLDPESDAYFQQTSVELSGDVSADALERAWRGVVARHEALRSSFHWDGLGQPVQVVHKDAELRIERSSLRGLTATAQRERLAELRRADQKKRFKLDEAPLMRLALVELDEGRSELIWSFHHLLMDGWCLPIVMKEVLGGYEAYRRGAEPRFGEVSRYRDYLSWLSKQRLTEAEAYYRKILRGFQAPTALGVAGGRVGAQPKTVREKKAQLSEAMTGKVKRCAAEQGVTANTLLQGAWALLLSRYSGQRDVVFGVTTSGRPAEVEGVEDMVGLFINTLPVRVELGAGESTKEVLTKLQAQQVESRRYEHAPLSKVQSWSEVDRGQPLFESLFVFENYPLGEVLKGGEVAGLKIEGAALVEHTNYALGMLVVPGAQVVLRLQYDAERFEAETVERMLGHYERLLDSIVERPEGRADELGLLTAAEKHQLLVEWSGRAKSYTEDALIHELIAAQAAKTPDAVALSFEQQTLSYRELDERANRLAHFLQRRGVRSEVLVGLCVERSLEMLVGLLGILKAGGAYVPLDPNYPSERLEYMVKDSGARLLLVQERLLGALPAHDAEVVCLDRDWAQIERHEKSAPSTRTGSDNLAYTIYTSGSTGRPKGVMNRHRGVCNRLLWGQDEYRLTANDIVLQKTPFSFDVSVWELFWPLMYGAKLVVARPEGHKDPAYLSELIEREGVTTVHFVPSMLAAFLETPRLETHCASVRQVMCSGEALTYEHQEKLFARISATTLNNLYGPTEAAVEVTYYACERDGGRRSVPIGRPVANTQMLVLDALGQLVPCGVSGELHIAGIQLGRGYLNRPDLTAEKFVPNPYGEPGARMYRTGDLARWSADGNIEYLGRIDHQVKVRGFRIELGEIESALVEAGAQEAVVVAREDSPGQKRLVAYVAGAVEVGALRAALSTKLPEYMVPSAFVVLEALPLLPNGKVDRKRLPAPEYEVDESAYVAPRSSVEEKLVEVWKELLKVERVGVRDNFFELGGDSILSIQVVSRAKALGVEITAKQLFEHPRVEDLARVAGRGVEVKAEQGVLSGELPPSPIEGWFFEHGDEEEPHHFNQAVMLKMKEAPDLGALSAVLAAVVKQHDALRLRYRRAEAGRKKELSGELAAVSIERVDLRGAADVPSTMEAHATQVQASLDLENGPLVRACVYELGAKDHRLLVVIHHVAVDGVSWRVLLEDLEKGYEAAKKGRAIELGKKTSSVRQWGERLSQWAKSEAERELEHWRGVSDGARLPRDREGKNLVEDAERLQVALTAEETEALLREVPAVYRTQVNDGLLLALGEAFETWTGSNRLLMNLEGHGREDVFVGLDVSRTVGWFTSLYPVVVDLSSSKETGARLKAVKEQQRKVPGRGLGYGALKYLGRDEVRAELGKQRAPEVLFNYLGQLDQALRAGSMFELAADSIGKAHSPRRVRDHLIDVVAMVSGGRLQLSFEYSHRLYRRETIEALAEAYTKSLRRLIEHCRNPEAGGHTPSDVVFGQLSQASLDKLATKLMRRK